ncbi:MAG: tetratricopeptide repeat protein [Chloroflexi bacterium]|nr:tetratricopeptide repeat protein [Chloroflexota bacterium]
MRTRLSYVCDLVMEAGWLLAIIAVPMFFNVFSSRIFEPDKIAFFRTLVLIMSAAWMIKIIDTRGGEISKDVGAGKGGGGATAIVRRLPFLLPLAAFVVITLVATVFSVDIDASLRGSYQRLQGTYTLLSYVVFFLIVIFNMRTKVQLRRAISFALLTAVPICLYGLIQHFQLDPLPWGGDVTFRVTSTMGNSIFLAAYLIMLVPLALSRIIESVARLRSKEEKRIDGEDIIWLAGAGTVVALQAVLFIWAIFTVAGDMTLGLWWLLPLILVVIGGLSYLLTRIRREGAIFQVGLLAGQVLLLVFLLAIIFFTQSRGPWLGLFAGILVFAILMVVRSGSKRLMGGVAAAALVVVAFLAVFNLPSTPLESLKAQPYIGRLGELMQTDTGTGKVRVLIWSGAVQMIFHDPFRTVIGYGPETMYQAYNPFYPPELAHVEARNATPDRSHNAYLDYLVTTGFLGLLAYLAMVGTFFTLTWRYFRGAGKGEMSFIIAALASAIAGHLVEIAFGIPIASTLVYFWLYLGMIVVAGLRLLPALADAGAPLPAAATVAGFPAKSKKKGKHDVRAKKGAETKRPALSFALSRKGFWWAYAAIGVAAVFLCVVLNVNPVRADMLFKMGTSYDNVGDVQGAISQYQEAISIAPNEDYYYLFLGRAYLEAAQSATTKGEQTTNLQEAEKVLLAARQIRPLNPDHSANLGRLYSTWANLMQDDSKRQEAVKYFTLATQLAPNNAQLRDELAQALAATGRYDEAMAQVQHSLQLDSTYAHTEVVAGDIQRQAGKAQEAAAAYAKAVLLDPNSISGDGLMDQRVDFLNQHQVTKDLTAALQQASQNAPNSPDPHAALGYIYSRIGDRDSAIKEYETALALDPSNITNRQNLAILYKDAGRLEDAAKQVESALQLAQMQQGVSQQQVSSLQTLQSEIQQAITK